MQQYTVDLDAVGSSQTLLLTLLGIALVAVILTRLGVIRRVLGLVRRVVQAALRLGFLLWRRTLSLLPWPALLAVLLGLVSFGAWYESRLPGLGMLCGLVTLVAAVATLFAYIFIDLERYEVARGFKAVHNPLMGQELALNLASYGGRANSLLLLSASVGVVGGFALLNYGLYDSFGHKWYHVANAGREPNFADFLAYSILNLYNVVDILQIANSYKYVHVSYVQQAQWPASTLLAIYKSFFTLVLLQQVFASVRRGRLLAETVSDFFSPVAPLRDRAGLTLPQFGAGVVAPLLLSLRPIAALTAEQRARLPQILADIGPPAIPHLRKRLKDPSPIARSVAVSALGMLHASSTLPELVKLKDDGDESVRQALSECLGTVGMVVRRIGSELVQPSWFERWFGQPTPIDPVRLALDTLRSLLEDAEPAIRAEAADALGRLGDIAAEAAPALIARLGDDNEMVRCHVAEALGQVGGAPAPRVAALAALLAEPIASLRIAAAHALGAMGTDAEAAVEALVPLLNVDDEALRQAAADAVGRIGVISPAAQNSLAEGLECHDTAVRARTAEALGEIGAAAAEATPALTEALADSNDRVRAKAAEALGRIGEGAAEAVPSLVKALHDQDSWVSALAAEALGSIGDSAGSAVPALIRSLRHTNPQVRANGAAALGKMGEAAATSRSALEAALADPVDAVRVAALEALSAIGAFSDAGRAALLTATDDPNPEIRAAALLSLSRHVDEQLAGPTLLRALQDGNETVRLHAAEELPKLLPASTEAIQGLERLLEDTSAEVCVQAARSLGQYGTAAATVGPALVKAVQAGEVTLRVESLRALSQIQPPEALEAFLIGLRDGDADVRKLASAGLILAPAIPENVVEEIVAALKDPESQVRANAARALLRVEILPAEAIPGLVACTSDPDDGVRLNAARALRAATPDAVKDVFHTLLADGNQRIRLLAAGFLLSVDAADADATEVVKASMTDAPIGIRRNAVELIAALGPTATTWAAVLQERAAQETDPALSGRMLELAETLTPSQPVADSVGQLVG